MNKLGIRAALGALLFATACAPTPTAPTGGQAPAPQRAANQVLTVAYINPTTLTPEAAVGSMTAFYGVQFDSILNMNKDFTVGPGLAEKWEILPDFSAWRFTLRKDMTFGNGEKMTADDAVFTIQTLLTPAVTNTVGRQMLYASGARKVDEFTFDITLKQKDFSLPFVMPNVFIMSKKQSDAVGGPKDLGVNPKGAGTGPYELAEARNNDVFVYNLRSTPHPYRKPVATQFRYRVVPEPQQQLNGIKTGDVDMIHILTIPDLADQAKRDGMMVDTASDAYVNTLFDRGAIRGTPLDNLKVRQAMNYAVDKETIGRTLYRGTTTPIGQLASPNSPNFNSDVKAFPYDVARAKALLTEAGYPNGFKLKGIDFSSGNPLTVSLHTAVQGYHRAVGIEYELSPLERGQYVAVALGQAPRKEMIEAGGSNPNGIFTFTWQFLKCDQPPQVLLYCVQAMDDKLAAAYQEPDINRRNQLLREAGKAWADDVPMVFLMGTSIFVVGSSKVQDFQRTTPSYFRFDSVWKAA